MSSGEVIVDEIRGGGALEAGDFEGASDEAGEAQGGIARGVFLVIGGFVGFVDDDLAEVANRGQEGGTRADNNQRLGRTVAGCGAEEDVEPDLAAFGGGLAGMDEEDALTEGGFEDFDELAGESDFRDEEDGGFAALEGFRGELEVDISLTAAGDAAEERGVSWGLLDSFEGFALGRIEIDEG